VSAVWTAESSLWVMNLPNRLSYAEPKMTAATMKAKLRAFPLGSLAARIAKS